MTSPICDAIQELERIYTFVAKHNGLDKIAPTPIITIMTKGRESHTQGWFQGNIWEDNKAIRDEINICAEYLNSEHITEILIHEMVHYHNDVEKAKDCNNNGYHNKHFKSRAEDYGLIVNKSGRNGWCETEASEDLQRVIDRIKVDYKLFELYRVVEKRTTAPTKMRKWTCECTIVRCATDLHAQCTECNTQFVEEVKT